MNKIYKLVWSKLRQCYVIACEFAKNDFTFSCFSRPLFSRFVVKHSVAGVLLVSLFSFVHPVISYADVPGTPTTSPSYLYGRSLQFGDSVNYVATVYHFNSSGYVDAVGYYTNGDREEGELYYLAGGGTTYNAGNGIVINGSTLSAKAGNGITINSNGISITSGSVASGNANAVTGGTAYSELRPSSNGTFVKTANTTASNLTALDTAAKNAIKGLSVSGQTITYTKGDGTTGTITTQDTTYGSGTAANLTTGTDTTVKVWTSKVLADYVTGKVSAEATARSNADTALGTRIDNEITTRSTADTALSNRIGTLSVDGNYIKKSATKNISENLSLLDTQIKTNATAIATETTNRLNADTALSNRIGTIDADGHVIKKSASNSVSANLKAIDAKIGALASDGNYVKNEYTVMRNINSIDSKLGNGDFTDGHFVETNTTFTGNIKRLDNRLNTAVNDLTNEINNRVAAQNAETFARSTEDTHLSNRIGVIEDAGYNYIRPSSEADIASNLIVFDTELKQTNDIVVANKTSFENSLASVVTNYQQADAEITARLDSVQAGDVYYDAPDKSQISLQGGSGTKLTNLIDGNVVLGSTDAVTGGQLYQTNQLLTQEVNNRVSAINNEISARSSADDLLSARIGVVSSNGNYIRSSDVNNVSANLLALDTKLKATNDDIAGFAADISRNKQSIRELNNSVTAALDSVATSSTLVDTVDELKADTNLNNLTAAGKRVIATAAVNAVQEYMAAQSGSSSAPMASMMYTQLSNSLTVTDAGNGSLHVGEGSYVNGTSSIAIGVGNQVNANNSGAFGDPSIIDADASYILGNDDRITANAKGSFIVGNDSKADAESSLIFGSNVESTGLNGLALGNNTRVLGVDSVAIGSHSEVSDSETVSFGNANLKRRLTNVSQGLLSQDSSDAVTGAQLYSTNQRVQANTDALSNKAEVDASNIDVQQWTQHLAVGSVEEGNNGLITGGQVHSAVSQVDNKFSSAVANLRNSALVKYDGNLVSVGREVGGNVVTFMNIAGQNRVLTGVVANPNDDYSVANVGYVNALNHSLVDSVNDAFAHVDTRINRVGANAAAMASLTPASFEGDEKWSLSAGIGAFHGQTAGAVGAFYKPAENVMLNVRGAFGSGENMIGGAVAVSLSKGDVPGVTKRKLAEAVNHQAQKLSETVEKLNMATALIQQQSQQLQAQNEKIAALEARLATSENS